MDATDKQIDFMLMLAAETDPTGRYRFVDDLSSHPAGLAITRRDRQSLSKVRASQIISTLKSFQSQQREDEKLRQLEAAAAERKARGLSPFAKLDDDDQRRGERRRTASSTATATAKQVALIQKLARGSRSVTTSIGRIDIPADLATMSRRDASDLIDTLTSHEM